MTEDEIIRMAREAGWDINDLIDVFDFGVRLEAFANLVTAAEREACETVVEDLARKYQQAHEVSAETVADACAYAIRARGNT
jgi:hypothetical protein